MFPFVPMFGIMAAVEVISITWLLSNNINILATVGENAVDGYDGVNRFPRIWTPSGLALPSGGIAGATPLSEGMRLSYDVDEGAALGEELATNGEFDTDTDWTKGSGTTIANGSLVYSSAAAGNSTFQGMGFSTGDVIQTVFTISNLSSGSIRIGGGVSLNEIAGAHRAANGTYTEIFTVPSNNNSMGFKVVTTFTGNIDVISVKPITPAFLNSVSKADATLLTPTKQLTENGITSTVFLLHDPRTNNESIVSEGRRYTGDAVPHNFWYRNQILASPATTSLTEPLRDSEGRFYEERVKNGGFDVDAEWILKSNTSISGGQLTIDTTGDSGWYDNAKNMGKETELGKRYFYEIDIATNTDELWLKLGTSLADWVKFTGTTGIFSGYVTVTTSATAITLEDRHSTGGLYVINSLSVVEVDALGNPINVLDGGARQSNTNVLLNSDAPATQSTGSLATGFWTLWATGTGTATVSAGTATIDTSAMGDATDGTLGSYIWFEVTGAGTVTVTESGTVDTFDLIEGAYTPNQSPHISTTSGSVQRNENVDESVLWSYGGRYQNIATATTNYLTHVLNEPAAVNLALQSQDFGTTWQAVGGATVTVNQTQAPDGAVTADLVQCSSAGQGVQQGFTNLPAGTYTISIYFKNYLAHQWVFLELYDAGDKVVWFDLLNGITGTESNATGEIESLGDDWYRMAVTYTKGSTFSPTIAFASVDSDGSFTRSGGVYAWQADLVAASSVSSPIPTTTGSVQRNSTSFTVPNPLPVNDFQIRGRAVVSDLSGFAYLFQARDTSGDNKFSVYTYLNDLYVQRKNGGSTSASLAVNNLISSGVSFNFGVAQSSSGGISLSVNGNSVTLPDQTTDLVIDSGTLYLGAEESVNILNGGITDLTISTDMSDADWYKDTTWSQP